MISSWSHSRIKLYEKCPKWAELKYIAKIPEPERPLSPGKTEHANDRGTRIHEGAERFVRGEAPFPPELKHFKDELEKLQRLFAAGKVSLEGEWAMDRGWCSTEWNAKNVWLRAKLDALVWLSQTSAVVIDYKTGKKFGNEVSHAEQGQLYQLLTFLRYPNLEEITVEFWYTDQNDMTSMVFSRSQGLRFKANWDRRANAMTTAIDFPARPNVFNCKWCPYGKWEGGTGDCERGVRL